MEEIKIYNKSLRQRLEEFHEVFGDFVSASCIKKQWGFFLQLTIDANGWQAIWKIPRLTCEILKIPFPTCVLVLVLHTDYKKIQALIRVIAIQDDILIPEKHIVPLIQLWPTVDQDKTIALDLENTANSLDMLRFFYLHIYMPWDRDEEESVNWRNKHLENRLRLYYDLKNGQIPRYAAEHIHSLLTEVRRLQNKREVLEVELENIELENVKHGGKDKFERIKEIHVRQIEIQREIEIYEDPLLRDVLIKKRADLDLAIKNKKQQIWAIAGENTAEEYINFLKRIEKSYPSQKLIMCTSLAEKLEVGNDKDIFLLNESEHTIQSTGALETGGTLKGIGNRDKIILNSNIDDIMLDIVGGDILIENLTINATSSQCAILVRSGKGILKGCKIFGDGESSTHQGIIVLKGAELELIDCDISGFYTSVVGNSGSKMFLQNCNIYSSIIGIKLFDKCNINMKHNRLHDCQEYGIAIESEKPIDREIGDFNILTSVPGISLEYITGQGNSMGDATIYQKPKLNPVEDLFANPDLDPTIINSDDENMECDQNLSKKLNENGVDEAAE